MTAAEDAIAAGADGIEVDVRLTSDGVPVCLHDFDLHRVAGLPLLVGRMTYDELQRVRLPGGHSVPRLEDVTRLVRGRALLVAELKDDPQSARIASAALRVLSRVGVCGEVVVSSFSETVLDSVRQLDPRVRRGLVTGPQVPAFVGLHRVIDRGHHELHAHVRAVLADHRVADRARQKGLGLRCWTVNRHVDARLLHILGVTAVITDDPAALRKSLDRPMTARR